MSTKVPPNGGWGWVIVLANALNGVSYDAHLITHQKYNIDVAKQ